MYNRKKKQWELNNTKQKVLSGQIPYMVADSGATLSCRRTRDPFTRMGQPLTKRFNTPFGQMVQATETAHLHHQVQKPERTVDIVTGLQHNVLLSINNFAEVNYVKVFTPDEVTIFVGQKASILSTNSPSSEGEETQQQVCGEYK